MYRCLGENYPKWNKALPNIKSAYITLRKLTPDSQIFYTFLVFGVNVQVPGVKLPQMKKALPNIKSVFITLRKKIYPRLPNILHLPSIWVKGTGAWGKITPNEMVHFHKALPNVKSAYVTVRKITPDLQKFYTDISAISLTFRNSASSPLQSLEDCFLF